MAYSIITTDGTNGFGPYTLNFTLGVLSRDLVKCRVNDEVDGFDQPIYRDIEWITDGMVNIDSGDEPTGADTVVFTRTMLVDELIHDYSDGATITESNLDESNLQTIMLVHQFLDGRITEPLQNDLDMGNHKIINLADGTDPEDAVNLSQLQPLLDDVAAIDQAVEDAESAAESAEADAVQTAADRVQTGLDATATAADRVQTGLDRVATGNDKTATNADVVLTHADVVLTHADVVATGNDADATAADAIATAADRVQTGLDATATAADRVQTGLDAVDTAADKIAAEAAAAAAASSAAEGLYNNVIDLVFADSPYVPLLADEGALYKINTTGGNVVVNLSSLATYNENMTFAFVKSDASGNSVTINRGGTDTINGATSAILSTRYETHVLVGEEATGEWLDTVQATGIADGSVTMAKLADLNESLIIGRAAGAGTGVPKGLTATEVRTIINFLDEDDMASNSATGIPSQQSSKAYVDTATTYVTINSPSVDYTAVLSDAGKCLLQTGASKTFTIPPNGGGGAVAYPVGTVLMFECSNATGVTIAITTDTLSSTLGSGSRTLAQYGQAFCHKITSTQWIINGSGLS